MCHGLCAQGVFHIKRKNELMLTSSASEQKELKGLRCTHMWWTTVLVLVQAQAYGAQLGFKKVLDLVGEKRASRVA
jgi:hypothetical protein